MPDITLTREPRGEGAIPLESVALVVEVSSTTLQRDTTQKVAIYAGAGIAEYWIIDVDARVIYQMWQPASDVYGERRDVAFGNRVSAATIPGLTIETTGL